MPDLVTFLRARLDDWERRILDLRQMTAEDQGCEPQIEEPDVVMIDVAAKRRIVDAHAPSADHFSDEAGEYDPRFPIRGRTHVCETCGQSNGEEWTGGFHPCGTLRLLALPFAGHPEYDESWRP